MGRLNSGQKISVPACRHTNGQGPCRIDEDFFVVQWDSVPNFCDPKDVKLAPCSSATSTFQVVLFNSGGIKFQYKNMAYNTNAYAVPRSGIENAAGNEGRVISQCTAGELTDRDPSSSVQCLRAQNFHPNTAYFLKDSCSSNPRTFSVGWCPSYNKPSPYTPGGATNTDRKCTFDVAEKLCQKNYGGQLASVVNRAELDTLNQLLPAAAGNEQYLLGLHSDTHGQWRYSDNTPCDAKCLAFLRAMSHDQLAGTSEHNLVFTPAQAYQGKGGLDDCCHSWNIDAFVCEAYAAPGSIAIGLGRTWTDANQFCMQHYGGTLLSIHDQHTYDELARLAQGYTQPIMIGLHSDGAGNWKWADKSAVKLDWLARRKRSQCSFHLSAKKVTIMEPIRTTTRAKRHAKPTRKIRFILIMHCTTGAQAHCRWPSHARQVVTLG